ncbi:MAG: c-type cytochrome [Verrucomicrobiaceae bacterium]|nr:c-type cytochrome [Verrucomicrobiaceae bacterium]
MRCTLFFVLVSSMGLGADLPPDKTSEIPAAAKREAVVSAGKPNAALPAHTLPKGYTLELAAAAPLVNHPIMGCLDDKGRLYVGDGVGVNWNKAQLEANPPNRVLMLEDADQDGWYEKSTVFADKMTFPQGAQWLDGSLYVCSPPGLWKLTDKDGDGVAEERKMIVSGFDYTGNAADVHGPFLNPKNGRLYFCHGRKGHKATDASGHVVHEGLACGIWSCKPDGSDLAWHALGCGDNPVEVDFTPAGDVVGVQNLYYTQPRGDTIVHWLYGGVYERSDQLKAIVGETRTLEAMPVMYNFGHVAVSGSCFWTRSEFGNGLQFMVTHFNTQRLVRMELTPHGGSFKATENEFLKLESPDIHFTDVMEQPDGSLLLLDTGGWFRIGCPSSLMAKPDVMGAIYRVRATKSAPKTPALASTNAHDQLHRCEEIAQTKNRKDEDREFLFGLLAGEIDAHLEHAALHAVRLNGWSLRDAYEKSQSTAFQRRTLRMAAAEKDGSSTWGLSAADKALGSSDTQLVQVAGRELAQPGWDIAEVARIIGHHLPKAATNAELRAALTPAIIAAGSTDDMTNAVTSLLNSQVSWALEIIASGGIKPNDAMVKRLTEELAEPNGALLDAVKALKLPVFDAELAKLADNAALPVSLRLKALGSMTKRNVSGPVFSMVVGILMDQGASAAARIQAAGLLAHSSLSHEEKRQMARAFRVVGPVELKELLGLVRGSKDEALLREMVTQLAANPALISQQESIYRTALADKPTELFENILLPAYQKGVAGIESRKRRLSELAELAANADPVAGKSAFESGKGTCIACHRIGDKGRAIGPDLTHIGAIRNERDLLESILFPSNTLARDYEAHLIETTKGESILGVVKSHTAEGLLVCDAAGMERNVPHETITADTTLTTSLMPMGLDQVMPEGELLQLVAYLRSLK